MKLATIFAALALVITLPRAAHAEVGIGLYSPSSSFAGTGERMRFVSALAKHVSAELGQEVTGRVYSSASSLAEALKQGDVSFAVVDVPNLGGHGWKPLATLKVGGSGTVRWRVLGASGVSTLADLKGKKVVIANAGGKASAFVTGVLFEGEVSASFLGGVDELPDAPSAVKAVTLGRADAVIVPDDVGTEGLTEVLVLRSIGRPVLIAASGTDKALVSSVVTAAKSWTGAGGSDGFGSVTGATPSSGRAKKKPAMVTPPPRKLSVKGILAKRAFTTPTVDLRRYVTK